MNAISKRMLSWLMIAAMALSMVPALNLRDFAVVTNAAETEELVAPAVTDPEVLAVQQEAEDKYKAALAAAKTLAEEAKASGNGLPTSTTCPLCGKENITWVEAKGTVTTALYSSTNNHIYVTGDVTVDASYESNGKTAYYYFMSNSSNSYKSCAFTNGYDITNVNTTVFFTGNGISNIVAVNWEGTDHSVIKGALTGSTVGATIQSNGGGNNTQGHFYGGIYEKLNPGTSANVIGGSGNSMNTYL